MSTVRQLLAQKGCEVWSISSDQTVFDAIKMMAEKNIGSLLVMDDGALTGIITERLYARNVILKGRTSPETRVGDIMEANVICTRPDQTVEQCMAQMTEKFVRHLPVIDGQEVIGIVSIGDIVKSIINDQKFVIDQLENYIRH